MSTDKAGWEGTELVHRIGCDRKKGKVWDIDANRFADLVLGMWSTSILTGQFITMKYKPQVKIGEKMLNARNFLS